MDRKTSVLQLSHPDGMIAKIVHDGRAIPLSVKRSSMADTAATTTSISTTTPASDWPCGTAEACVIQSTTQIDDSRSAADNGSCQGNMLGVCIGASIGAPLLLGLVICIFLLIRRRKRRSARKPLLAAHLETPPRET